MPATSAGMTVMGVVSGQNAMSAVRKGRTGHSVALCRASTPCFTSRMAGGWVYFMTNRRDGILYAGVTSDLARRAFEHRDGLVKGFTKTYGLKMLVYFERHDDIRDAIQREKTIKHWPRAWKVRLIHTTNAEWKDLYDTLA